MSAPLVLPVTCRDGVVRIDAERLNMAADTASKMARALCLSRFGADALLDMELRPRRSKRSVRANAALHAGLHEWAAHRQLTGAAAKQWVEDIKDDLLKLCFGVVVRQSPLTGEITTRLAKPHTADLSVEDFTELFDVAIVEAAKSGFMWTLPEEFAPKKTKAA